MRARCPGVGLPVTNVSRDRLRGGRLPVRGDCPECLRRVEITRNWTAKSHHPLPAAAATEGEGGGR